MGPSNAQDDRGFGALCSRLGDGLPVADNLSGVVLFADLAGFTALAESLEAAGPAGGERLHALLNGYFSVLIDRVSAAGGEVTTFAGDALAAVFDLRRGPWAPGAERALRCAVDLQDALPRVAAASLPDLGTQPHLKIGLGAGPITRALVGHEDLKVLHVLAGAAVDRAVAAQAHSGVGEVLADAGLVAALPRAWATTRRDRWCVLRPAAMTTASAAGRGHGGSAVPRPDLRPARSASLTRGLLDEHRLVTSVFLALPDMGVPRDGAARLQDYLAVAMPVLHRYDGDLRQVDAGDKGYQLVVGFGAPRTAADDAERAVGCCLELVRETPVGARAGVATGPVFCADVGTLLRREYVVLGDSVNVAARLASLAGPGEVWVDAGTSGRCTAFAQRALGPVQVKGRRVRVEAFAVHGLRDATTAAPALVPSGRSPLIGRSAELAVARGCQERAYGGEGQVLVVTGEPGMGKSRLVAELVHPDAGPRLGNGTAYGAGSRPSGVVGVGAGSVPGDARPYLAWRPVWRALLLPGLEHPSPGNVQAVADAEGQADRAPLLGTVLGVPVPDTAFTASLSPAERADATRAVLLQRLRWCCADAPVTVVVDDAQWLDELSRGLLENLAAHVADLRLLLVVVAREEPRAAALLARLRALPRCTSVVLAGLPPAEAEQLVRARAARANATFAGSGSPGAGDGVPPDLVGRIARRGAGNPLFLEQLVGWALDHAGEGEPVGPADLPPDVRRLVLARVDRLVPHGQVTLKVASVLAEEISPAAVHACLAAGTRSRVERDLRQLAALDLLTVDGAGAEPSYAFRHPLIQEVVYGSLSSTARSELHEGVGVHLEQAHAGDLAPWVDQLAYHFGRSRNVGKQRTWFRAAGDAAAHAYANDAALGHYERLAALLPAEEIPEVLVRIGAIHQLTGGWREAESVLRTALDAAPDGQPRVAAEAERELGLVLLSTRHHGEAVRRLRSAADALSRLGDPGGQAEALDRLAFALFEHGDYQAALQTAQEQLAVQEARQDTAGVAAALENIALVHWRCGDHQQAMPLLRRAYVLARRSGDRRLVVHTANDLAGLCAERADHVRAVRYLREAITTAQHIGYRQATAYLTGNAGELYRERGDAEQAQRHFAAGLRAALDIGDWITTVYCVASMAMTAADAKAPGHQDLLRRGCAVAGQLHQSYILAEVLLRRAEAALDDGDAAGAVPLVAVAEAAARRLSDKGPTLRPHLLRLRVDVDTGRVGARAAAREVRAMLPEWPDAPERALLLDTLARVDPSAAWAAGEAAALYRKLYARAPSHVYATAYRRLTGGRGDLPPAAPLPPLGVVADEPVDLEELFCRVEALAADAPALP